MMNLKLKKWTFKASTLSVLAVLSVMVFGASNSTSLAPNFTQIVDLAEHKGTPYFELMRTKIKPMLDRYAEEGFVVADGKTVVSALDLVSRKVAAGAMKGMREKDIFAVADSLNRSGKKITFYDLPEVLSNTRGFRGDRYDFTTFLALVSGGGVAVKIADEIYAYNVNYGTGKIDKDEMTGRSFGAAGSYHKADDASDAAYLRALNAVARPKTPDNGRDVMEFIRTILQVIVSSDASNIKNISNDAKAVASDFIAVYTAEQDRHLMANLKSHHWDSALLEVTLLAAFHAGQDKLTLFTEVKEGVYEFSDKVIDQIARRRTPPDLRPRDAGLVDYWQFSKNPENPNRSGINITRGSFSRLESAITAYERKHHPELVKNIERQIKGGSNGRNIFDSVSDFLINFKTQNDVRNAGAKLTEAYVQFLDQVRKDANLISKEIESKQ
jgi:hypothetical protein